MKISTLRKLLKISHWIGAHRAVTGIVIAALILGICAGGFTAVRNVQARGGSLFGAEPETETEAPETAALPETEPETETETETEPEPERIFTSTWLAMRAMAPGALDALQPEEEELEVPEVVVAPVNDPEDSQTSHMADGDSSTAAPAAADTQQAIQVFEPPAPAEPSDDPSGTSAPSEYLENSYGIDVSKYQGNINWAAVAADGVQFAMIRIGYRGSDSGTIVMDPYFTRNINGAIAAGIKVGVYFYSQATTEAEARQEANWVASVLRSYPVTYPVAFDMERLGDNSTRAGAALTTNELRTNIARAWLAQISANGYQGMIYGSTSKLTHMFDMGRLSAYKVWVAQYNSTFTCKYTGTYHMFQYTSSGHVNGISGNVDMNVAFFSYSNTARAQVDDGSVVNGFTFTDLDASAQGAGAPVYSQPGTESDRLGTLEENEILSVTACGESEYSNQIWFRVSYNGSTGYLLGSDAFVYRITEVTVNGDTELAGGSAADYTALVSGVRVIDSKSSEALSEDDLGGVTWTVSGADDGTAISAEGRLTTSSDTNGTVTVTAASDYDSSVKGSLEVTVRSETETETETETPGETPNGNNGTPDDNIVTPNVTPNDNSGTTDDNSVTPDVTPDDNSGTTDDNSVTPNGTQDGNSVTPGDNSVTPNGTQDGNAGTPNGNTGTPNGTQDGNSVTPGDNTGTPGGTPVNTGTTGETQYETDTPSETQYETETPPGESD